VFGVGGSELAIIAVIALILTGGGALPFIAGYFVDKNRGGRSGAPKAPRSEQPEPAERGSEE
jgi:Sec-independent protein translocase protein TatA